ncbi:MAG: HEAT repeat domain-containing protein [Planctomycetaceae bacterium]|jgi:hypothetical protein|nr:HEAT repeat domain-containing protein [Planctomycetaceae bacterium]
MLKQIMFFAFIIFLFQNFVVALFAQQLVNSEIKWNYDATPSFRESVKTTASKIFLPTLPAKNIVAKNTIEVEKVYRDDSVKILSVFLKSTLIPKELNTNLIAFKNTNEKPIIMLPNFMTNKPEPCNDGFIASWSNWQFSFLYIDTAKCVVLGIKSNPKTYNPDRDYELVKPVFNESFNRTFDIEEFFLDEKVFSRAPSQVAAYYKRPIMDNERDKKTSWGLAGNFTLCSDNLTTVFFHCEKNIPDNIDANTYSRFSKNITMENLVPVSAKRLEEEKQKIAQSNPVKSPPSPANATTKTITEYNNKIINAEKEIQELIKTESGRLQLIDSLSKTTWHDYENLARLALENYFRNNAKKIREKELNKIHELLKSDNIEIRRYGISFITLSQAPDAARILEKLFETETDSITQRAIINSLSTIGDKNTLKFLENIQSNENLKPLVRQDARITIKKIKSCF